MTTLDLYAERWRPTSGRRLSGRPEPGQLLGLFYAAWRVLEVRPYLDVDLDDDQRKHLALWKPEFREVHRPYHMVLEHERGPVLVETKRHHYYDGVLRMSFTVNGYASGLFLLGDRYAVCSCHGDPWPCQDDDRDHVAQEAGQKMDRLLATVTPGICAGCLEPITARQPTITFPEGHVQIPGAPGPTYHAGRGRCWYAAAQYEEKYRLRAHPDADRVASCPGYLFVHAGDLSADCSAGPACTGHHGPGMKRGRRYGDCFTRMYDGSALSAPIPRPTRSCGYGDHGGCLGVEMTDG